MSMLGNQLRLHRWQLKERERYLADLEALAERLRADGERLQNEAERRAKLERSVVELEEQIAQARQAVGLAEQEVKRHELAWAHRIGAAERRLAGRSRRNQRMGTPLPIIGPAAGERGR